MIASRTTLIAVRHTQARILSSQTTTAVDQLRSALEDYRKVHYAQELKNRFHKDIVRATSPSNDRIAMDGLQRVLTNIGAPPIDLHHIFREIGDDSQTMSTQRFVQML